MRRLPDHWGPFHGIDGLPLIVVSSNALFYLVELVSPGFTQYLLLSPESLRAGEYWRLLTFLFVPPPGLNALFAVFWFALFYMYMDGLERAWGAFRLTVYYLTGALATAAVALAPGFGIVPNVYLNASLALAFAALFPEVQLLLFFIIPVKVKWLAYFTWAWLAWCLWVGGLLDRLAILAALVPFFLLLGPDIWENLSLWLQVRRNRMKWK